MGLRGRAISLFPSGAGLEWLRGLGAGLIGGGAPVAAKVGAVFATATLVGGGTAAVERTNHHHVQRAVLSIARATPVKHAVRAVSLASAAVSVVAVTAPVHRVVVDEHKSSSGDGGSFRSSTAKEHEAQQIAEHGGPSSDGNASSGDGEHMTTIANEQQDTSSHEHSGQSSETQRTETQPTETQPAESQPPQDTTTTTTTTSAAIATPPPPEVPVIISPSD